MRIVCRSDVRSSWASERNALKVQHEAEFEDMAMAFEARKISLNTEYEMALEEFNKTLESRKRVIELQHSEDLLILKATGDAKREKMKVDLVNQVVEMKQKYEVQLGEELETLRINLEKRKQAMINGLKEELEDLEEEHEMELEKRKSANESELQREQLSHEKRIELLRMDESMGEVFAPHHPIVDVHAVKTELTLESFESLIIGKPKKKKKDRKIVAFVDSFGIPGLVPQLTLEITQVVDQGEARGRTASPLMSELTPPIEPPSRVFEDLTPGSPMVGKSFHSSNKTVFKAEMTAKRLMNTVKAYGNDAHEILKSQEQFLKGQREFLASCVLHFQRQTFAIGEQFRDVVSNVEGAYRLATTTLLAARNQELSTLAEVSAHDDDGDILKMAKKFRLLRRSHGL
jgi:hypothetical protein